MIAYFDTSALIPLVLNEPSTDLCRRIWHDADHCVTSRVTYVETAAALAMAERQGRITTRQHDASWSNILTIWPELDIVEVTSALSTAAADVARSLGLRGYDAIHAASAHAVADDTLVAAAGDRHLLHAWRLLGLAVIDTNAAR